MPRKFLKAGVLRDEGGERVGQKDEQNALDKRDKKMYNIRDKHTKKKRMRGGLLRSDGNEREGRCADGSKEE